MSKAHTTGPPALRNRSMASADSHLNEADILRVLTETLAAHIEAVLPDQTVPVRAHAAVRRDGVTARPQKFKDPVH